MLRRRPRSVPRRDALNAMTEKMGATAFTAQISILNVNSQAQCSLFEALPPELRLRIFEYACTSTNDVSQPYAKDRVYYRPGYHYRQEAEVNLLLTCKRIYEETRLMPVSQAEHSFWLLGGPFHNLRIRKHAVGNFGEWQKSLNEDQKAAVNYVHLFAQQFYLERIDKNVNATGLKFKTKVFILTFRHSDWWSWESPPESTDKLGICPWLPDRVSHQTMLEQPLQPDLQALRASMIKGTWGWQIGQIEGLEVFRIEFETDVLKKDQLKLIIERAKHWMFPIHGKDAVMVCTGDVNESEWTGQARLNTDNLPALRHVETNGTSLSETPMRTCWVAELTWARRAVTSDGAVI